MTKNLGFITALPDDIILEVFSYVSQEDCLRCMTVCRAWDHAIPQYTQNLWKEVKLYTSDAYKDYQRRERCLGTHVKHVVLDTFKYRRREQRPGNDVTHTGIDALPATSIPTEESQLYLLMQRLFDWGCTEVESLGIRMLESVTDQGTFISSLQKLSSHLTHMKMVNHGSSVLLPHLLNACPELTHVTDACAGQKSITFPTKIRINHTTKIKYLCLNYAMDKEQLECILRKCPDLSCLIARSPLRGQSVGPFVDLDSLFFWCPKISYLSTTPNPLFGLPEHINAYISDNRGLRYLDTASYYGQNQIARHLEGNQNILEFLSIGNHLGNVDDWSLTFRSLQLPRLHTLNIHGIYIDAESLVALLDHCTSLERLQLNCPELFLTSSAIRRLNTMHHLRSLTYHSSLDSECSLLTMLERFPVLEKLILSKIPLSVELPSCFEYPTRLAHLSLLAVTWTHGQGMDKDESVACFFRSLALKSNLESIQVSHGEALGYKSLRTLAMIPTLKLLTVHLDPMVLDDKLLQFIKLLGGTAIETLKLVIANQLSYAAFDALAELPLLKHLSLEPRMADRRIPRRVSKESLQQILCQSPMLARAQLSNIVIEDNGVELTRDQIEELIQQQIPRYSSPTAERWKIRFTVVHPANLILRHKPMFDVDIQRTAIH